MDRLSTGRLGEELAERWLQQHGFTILHRNWKGGRNEIDIIAFREKILHFVEVKTRRGQQFGYPEEQVDGWKLHCLQKAAGYYLQQHPQWRRIQFDVLAIQLENGETIFNYLPDIS